MLAKVNTKNTLTLIIIICLISVTTVQAVEEPAEIHECENSESITPVETSKIRTWLVYGFGSLKYDLSHGRFFIPALQSGPLPGGGWSLTRYIDLDDNSDCGPIYSGVIWKNANPTGEYNCRFRGHMGLTTIFGIYTVEFF